MKKNPTPAVFAGPPPGAAGRGVLSGYTALAAGILLAVNSAVSGAQVVTGAPPDLAKLALPQAQTVVDASLHTMHGPVTVVIQLTGPSLAKAMGTNAKSAAQLDRTRQRARLTAAKAEQDAVGRAVSNLGGKEIGRVSKALNAVVATIDAKNVAALAATPGVASIRPLRSYEMHLGETVPYLGARSGPLGSGGADGTGITVAVLDSGIDYTHANLGGPGTPEAYEAAYGAAPGDTRQTSRDGLFPTAKVIDGYDFVGEDWPNSPEAGDDDPIDFEGHGTHVADIIAGNGGMAPGANLVAVKVCSAVATSCSGLALLQGMDYALDPNGDGDMSDAVDVINMSLGSSYGQREDDLSFAAGNAVNFGVTVVVSAGNSADRPYIVGSPSSTPGVISVAQTQVPSALAFPLVVTGISPSLIGNTATVDWAPVGNGFSGDVVRLGRGCPGDAFFNNNSAAGAVVLIDRGACSVSLKTDVATKAGAIGVIIANNVAGDPPSFSFGGGDLPLAPTMVISLADGNRIKAALGATGINPAVTATVSPDVSIPLAGSMVASSSRGPSMSFDAIKPDVGAPGASVSAIAGSGTGTGAFGGTSGAAPMVSGAAALLLSVDPKMSPQTVKGRLMGSGETQIFTNPATQPGVLAPITRIGGGEVRVDRAVEASTIAFDTASRQPSLSFGYLTVTGTRTLERNLTIRNLGTETRTYTVTPTFRFADDQASGAVTPTVSGGGSVSVGAGAEGTLSVSLAIDPTLLPAWQLDSAANQGNGALLNGPEFDGYLAVSGGGDEIHVPWHVLPRAAGNVTSSRSRVNLASLKAPTVTVANSGAVDGAFSAFALTGRSDRIPQNLQSGAGDNLATVDLKAVGVRAFPSFDAMQFAVNTWDERSHPSYPAGFEIYLDTNLDGDPDWVVYNQESGSFASTGQTLVYVVNLSSGTGGAYYYLDADLNSSNRVFTVPMSVMGLTAASQFDYTVLAYDNYFSGAVTDLIGPMRFTAGTPRYLFAGDLNDSALPPGGSAEAALSAVAGGAAASPSQTGILLMHYANPQRAEASMIEVR